MRGWKFQTECLFPLHELSARHFASAAINHAHGPPVSGRVYLHHLGARTYLQRWAHASHVHLAGMVADLHVTRSRGLGCNAVLASVRVTP